MSSKDKNSVPQATKSLRPRKKKVGSLTEAETEVEEAPEQMELPPVNSDGEEEEQEDEPKSSSARSKKSSGSAKDFSLHLQNLI